MMKTKYPMAMAIEPGKIAFVDRELSELSPSEVLVKTRAASICGSDLHLFKGKHPAVSLPAAVGHELAGEILKVGAGVTRVKEGDRVVVEPVIVCGECRFCRQGDYNLCTSINFHYRKGQGSFAPYFVAEETWVHQLPDNISFAEGSLMEPLSVAVHAVQKARLQLGQNVAVFGAGAIGLLVVLLAKRSGAGKIYSVDVQEYRLEKARELGATAVFNNMDGDAVAAVFEATEKVGVDVSFEAVGLETTLFQSLEVLRKGGTAILLGLFAEPQVTIPANIFVQKEISLIGSQGYCHDFQTALGLVGSGDITLKPLVTHTLPLTSLREGFDILRDPEKKGIKVVITID